MIAVAPVVERRCVNSNCFVDSNPKLVVKTK